MEIEIEYCAVCNYEPQVMELTEKLLKFKNDINSVRLIPSAQQCFEIRVDGKKIYSKLETRPFPKPRDILIKVRELIRSEIK
ncbi:MAG TPA: SelT/SelW/SelH family protein [Verrucomicrobiales bacterium]|jgi:selT/selW/selH-like putative selenoprotein|nr:SelT/SelW/SelH family protein [Verrucomicrobiales bacterium]